MPRIQGAMILLPWPILYETLRTNFLKRPKNVSLFCDQLPRLNHVKVPDDAYREKALIECLDWATRNGRQLSLADVVLRYIMQDTAWRVGYLATFNGKDFSDVCAKKRIEIIAA